MLNHGQLFAGNVVFFAREDKDTGTHFLQPFDETVGHLIKNGNVDSDKFLKSFSKVDDLREVNEEKEFAYLRNIGKPFGPIPFYKALAACIKGHKIARNGWNGRNMFISYYTAKDSDPFSNDILMITTPHGGVNPWVPSQTDQLANDWVIV